ncbi:hypothetical protein TNCV_4611791 [Trichonephila clavipes]|nr:hypothetical protein TNCV_4611791 [Trichonephila clavipes]
MVSLGHPSLPTDLGRLNDKEASPGQVTGFFVLILVSSSVYYHTSGIAIKIARWMGDANEGGLLITSDGFVHKTNRRNIWQNELECEQSEREFFWNVSRVSGIERLLLHVLISPRYATNSAMAVTYVTGPLSGDSLEKRSTNIPPQLKLILVKGRLGNQAFEDMERVHWADPQWVVLGFAQNHIGMQGRKWCKEAEKKSRNNKA